LWEIGNQEGDPTLPSRGIPRKLPLLH